MNIIHTTIALLFCHVAFSQVSLQTNIPPAITPNTTLNLEVKITKGSISSFSKYQIDVPAGVTIAEANSKTGNFTFDAPRAKIVWVNIPAEPEFVVKFIMNTGSAVGPGVFNQKLYYVDEAGKKEFEAEPLNINIDASGVSTTTSFPETGSVASNNTAVNSGSVAGAESSGSSGNTGSATASSTSNTVASSTSSGSSGSASENTSGTSSGTLASNTNSSSSANSGSVAVAETKTKENTSSGTASSGSSGSSGNTGEITAKTVKENPSGTGNSSGLVYKVQLGAYGADPGKSRFSAAGKVTISKEDGLYKVITGNYNSKEEAIQANEALKSKGFTGFVVKYQNGVRVK